MPRQNAHEFMMNSDKVFEIIQQSSPKGGIRAPEIAEKLDWHKTTVYNYLNSLQLKGRIESQQGLWKVKSGEPEVQPLAEKEIIIQLPLPDKNWRQMALLEAQANELEQMGLKRTENTVRILIDKYNETRTIKISGKNVDDMDLEKVATLIEQATKKSGKFDFKKFFRIGKTKPKTETPST